MNKQQQLNNTARQSLENNVINPLAQRGLTRGSSVNQMSNQLNNKLTDAQLDLMNSEDTRVSNVLNQLFDYYGVPYNMMNPSAERSISLYQSANKNSGGSGMGSKIGAGLGAAIGAYFSGGTGAGAGAAVGSKVGGIFDE